MAIGAWALDFNSTGEQNVVIGESASAQGGGAVSYTVAIGRAALFRNVTSGNTAVGFEAGLGNTTGEALTATGFKALRSNTTGIQNTAHGYAALHNNSTGVNNTAMGAYSLIGNTTGHSNTAIGMQALFTNTTGEYNTAIGSETLRSNTTGSDNTAVGVRALYVNTTGSGSVAVGRDALLLNTTGTDNTAVGYQAMYSNEWGRYNTATGYQAMYGGMYGSNNTANGYRALYSGSEGGNNTASGAYALYSNVKGGGNTANGHGALYSNYSGWYTTAIGEGALHSVTYSDGNTAIGSQALYRNTGGDNTAIGNEALSTNEGGSGNTAIGEIALASNRNGNNNTAIGLGADVSTYNLSNATAIGAWALATASNQVVIGNSSVTSIGGYVPWTTISDRRVKKNIKAEVPGLEFIRILQPVTYNMDLDAADNLVKAGISTDIVNDSLRALAAQPPVDVKARAAREKRVHTGFIAQDVEKAAQSIGYDFSGVDADESGNGLYGLRYSEFVVPLVKAVQELSAQNEELQSRIDRLEELVSGLLGQEEKPFPDKRSFSLPEASLEQNFPNPFNQSTTIRFILPEAFRSAQIVITAVSGRVYRQIPISVPGADSVTVEAGVLPTGTYYYSLYVDGMLVDTKKMVVTN